MKHAAAPLWAALALALWGCGPPGAQDGAVDAGPDLCDYDTLTSPTTAGAAVVGALPLTCPVGTTAGMETEGLVCPGGDDDWYSFTMPAGDDIVVVRLRNTTPLTNVDLAYALYNSDGMTIVPNGSDSDADGSDGVTCFTFNHLVTPGDLYYVSVSDTDIGAGEADDRNSYLLAIATAADGDPFERNDDMASATPITPGAAMAGAQIAYKADEDWYTFTAGASDALQIDLNTSAASPVDIHFRLVDPAGVTFAEGGDVDGSNGPTMFTELRGLQGAGTYYIVVTDDGETESDLAMTYDLTITLVTNPDTNEPNNTAATATVLGSWTSGGPIMFTDTGRLFTPGDNDWFKIDTTGAGGRGVIEVTVNAGAGIPVLVSLETTDPNTPCTGATDCTVLTSTCPYTTDPEDFEWLNCAQGFVCNTTAEPDACGGTGECLPAGGGTHCGYIQVVRGPDTLVTTAQPVIPGGSVWIRVAAGMPGASDLSNDYTITVRIRNEPDAGEPDEYNFPDFVRTQFGVCPPGDCPDPSVPCPCSNAAIYDEVLSRSFPIADSVPARAVSLGVTYNGYLSYEGDIDVWVLPDPCPAQDCGYAITYSFPAGNVEYKWFAHRDPGSLNCSFGDEGEAMGSRTPAGADAGTFGAPSDCCWFSVAESGDYHIVIRDHNFNDWEWSNPYSFSVTAVGVGAACTPAATPGTCVDPAPFCSGTVSSNPCCPSGCCALAYAEGCGCF